MNTESDLYVVGYVVCQLASCLHITNADRSTGIFSAAASLLRERVHWIIPWEEVHWREDTLGGVKEYGDAINGFCAVDVQLVTHLNEATICLHPKYW